MTNDDKQLLIKDLCPRLPYGVICDMWDELESESKITERLKMGGLSAFYEYHGFVVRPYLRPMSSMTEEEKKEFQACHCVYGLHPDFQPMMCNLANELNMFDWLNKHAFDYRGLIKKGLALEAPEGMYKI